MSVPTDQMCVCVTIDSNLNISSKICYSTQTTKDALICRHVRYAGKMLNTSWPIYTRKVWLYDSWYNSNLSYSKPRLFPLKVLTHYVLKYNCAVLRRIIWQNVITCICLRRVMIDRLHGFAFLSHFTHKCTRCNASLSISALSPSFVRV